MTAPLGTRVIVFALLSACDREKGASQTNLSAPLGSSAGQTASAHADRAESAKVAESSARSSPFEERVAEREALARALAHDGIKDDAVLQAVRTVPRHAFVPAAVRGSAYADRPLPILSGQTISQPFIVAFMSEAAKPTRESKCLEIGTGSGYQAAVLAELCRHVYSIEYLADVARFGESNLRAAGYGSDRVSLRVGDGYLGWPEAAPFDVILVTAAPEKVPEPLLAQLRVGGRLIVPVGRAGDTQRLERWTRLRTGHDQKAFRLEPLMAVAFVPFAGENAARGGAP